ncbi:hypothetical protein M440DRAFT_1403783 [Trichoderma longibrachiatum ATCC 18648]|uniref:Uncharacterized protein n=1 Tax=Trichoderma longibrachiatum ATCC 18648 TaxID=983965 RepID=A0A2T4BYK8_TRILO|nr:hypothetical protein M440DRAFT_1403783 [Trichoderma longibrachiatum ATCC 18648]
MVAGRGASRSKLDAATAIHWPSPVDSMNDEGAQSSTVQLTNWGGGFSLAAIDLMGLVFVVGGINCTAVHFNPSQVCFRYGLH